MIAPSGRGPAALACLMSISAPASLMPSPSAVAFTSARGARSRMARLDSDSSSALRDGSFLFLSTD